MDLVFADSVRRKRSI